MTTNDKLIDEIREVMDAVSEFYHPELPVALAQLIRAAQAGAWARGHACGIEDLKRQIQYSRGLGIWPEPPRDTPNPYVTWANEEGKR